MIPLVISSQLDKDVRDKREASRKGFKMRVDEIVQKMQRYTDELQHKEDSLGEMTRNLDEVKTRLKEVDERLRQLRPGIRLDTLEERCKLRKKLCTVICINVNWEIFVVKKHSCSMQV